MRHHSLVVATAALIGNSEAAAVGGNTTSSSATLSVDKIALRNLFNNSRAFDSVLSESEDYKITHNRTTVIEFDGNNLTNHPVNLQYGWRVCQEGAHYDVEIEINDVTDEEYNVDCGTNLAFAVSPSEEQVEGQMKRYMNSGDHVIEKMVIRERVVHTNLFNNSRAFAVQKQDNPDYYQATHTRTTVFDGNDLTNHPVNLQYGSPVCFDNVSYVVEIEINGIIDIKAFCQRDGRQIKRYVNSGNDVIKKMVIREFVHIFFVLDENESYEPELYAEDMDVVVILGLYAEDVVVHVDVLPKNLIKFDGYPSNNSLIHDWKHAQPIIFSTEVKRLECNTTFEQPWLQLVADNGKVVAEINYTTLVSVSKCIAGEWTLIDIAITNHSSYVPAVESIRLVKLDESILNNTEFRNTYIGAVSEESSNTSIGEPAAIESSNTSIGEPAAIVLSPNSHVLSYGRRHGRNHSTWLWRGTRANSPIHSKPAFVGNRTVLTLMPGYQLVLSEILALSEQVEEIRVRGTIIASRYIWKKMHPRGSLPTVHCNGTGMEPGPKNDTCQCHGPEFYVATRRGHNYCAINETYSAESPDIYDILTNTSTFTNVLNGSFNGSCAGEIYDDDANYTVEFKHCYVNHGEFGINVPVVVSHEVYHPMCKEWASNLTKYIDSLSKDDFNLLKEEDNENSTNVPSEELNNSWDKIGKSIPETPPILHFLNITMSRFGSDKKWHHRHTSVTFHFTDICTKKGESVFYSKRFDEMKYGYMTLESISIIDKTKPNYESWKVGMKSASSIEYLPMNLLRNTVADYDDEKNLYMEEVASRPDKKHGKVDTARKKLYASTQEFRPSQIRARLGDIEFGGNERSGEIHGYYNWQYMASRPFIYVHAWILPPECKKWWHRPIELTIGFNFGSRTGLEGTESHQESIKLEDEEGEPLKCMKNPKWQPVGKIIRVYNKGIDRTPHEEDVVSEIYVKSLKGGVNTSIDDIYISIIPESDRGASVSEQVNYLESFDTVLFSKGDSLFHKRCRAPKILGNFNIYGGSTFRPHEKDLFTGIENDCTIHEVASDQKSKSEKIFLAVSLVAIAGLWIGIDLLIYELCTAEMRYYVEWYVWILRWDYKITKASIQCASYNDVVTNTDDKYCQKEAGHLFGKFVREGTFGRFSKMFNYNYFGINKYKTPFGNLLLKTLEKKVEHFVEMAGGKYVVNNLPGKQVREIKKYMSDWEWMLEDVHFKEAYEESEVINSYHEKFDDYEYDSDEPDPDDDESIPFQPDYEETPMDL